MTNDLIYSLTTNTFVLSWLLLSAAIFLSKASISRTRLLWVGGRLIPVALLISFLAGFIASKDIEPNGSLFSYTGILIKFSVPERLLNIWIEVLAYALLVGRWIIDDAASRGISKIYVLICMIVVFISGGLGLLSYLCVLTVRKAVPAKTVEA